MAISQGLLVLLLINSLGNKVYFQQNLQKRSLENYSAESCQNQLNQELNSHLWVMHTNPPVYFFGTIHVPYTKVWDYIPSNSKRAFKTAKNVYFELDLTDQSNLRTLEQCKSLPRGIKLRDMLPPSMYKRIKTHLSYVRGKLSKWITFEQTFTGLNPLRLYQQMTKSWRKKRPIWIMLLLGKLTEYNVKMIAQGLPVLDTYLMQEALSNHKKLGSIETVKEQCQVLNKLNNSKAIFALNQTLILHEKMRRGEQNLPVTTKQLVYHYNCGDLNEVLFSQEASGMANMANISETNSFQKEQKKRFEEDMKEELFFKRNKKMAKRILKIIIEEPKKIKFFALGAGHFIGNNSIISILQSQGYKITHLKASDPLPRYGPDRNAKDCKLKKKKRGRKNGGKQKRKRFRSRKACSNVIQREQLVTKPKTTLCTSCQTPMPTGLKKAFSSSISGHGHQLWMVTLVLVVFF